MGLFNLMKKRYLYTEKELDLYEKYIMELKQKVKEMSGYRVTNKKQL